jgi:hypothetical protein
MNTGDQTIENSIHLSDPCCGTGDFHILTAYLDGELSPQHRSEFQTHLSTCSLCRHYVDVSTITMQAAKNMSAKNDAMIRSISADGILNAKSKLLQSIREEYTVQNEVPQEEQSKKRPRIDFFSRFARNPISSYAATAAVFVVLFLSIAVYTGIGRLSKDAPLFPEGHEMATNGDAFDNPDGNDSSYDDAEGAASYSDETADTKNHTETDASVILPSGDFSAVPSSERQYLAPSDAFWLDDARADEYRRNVEQALFSVEFADTTYVYIGIFGYPMDQIDDYRSILKNLVSESQYQPVIEIIGGENSQKLVEYTGEDEALFLLQRAEKNNALLLVVSIGR